MSEWTCSRCGRCCTEFCMFVVDEDGDAEKFWKLRGFDTRHLPNGQSEVRFRRGCAWLVWDGTRPRCTNYDNRPTVCRTYTCQNREAR